MDTKEMFSKCCRHGKNKKVVVLLVLLVAVVFVSALLVNGRRELRSNGNYGYGQIMGGKNFVYPYQTDNNQFIPPADAAKKGEIAIIVSDLEIAKKNISDIAAKDGGTVYSSHIEYASGNLKNGSVVVQIPAGSFEKAFSDLKTIGSQVVQESTENISTNNIYPYAVPMMSGAASGKATDTIEPAAPAGEKIVDNKPVVDNPNAASSIAIAPYPYPQPAQDKGYIRIIFADYGNNYAAKNNSGMMSGYAGSSPLLGYGGQNMRNNLLAVLAIKIAILIVLMGILVVIFLRIGRHYKKAKTHREEKRKPIIIRQSSKTHRRVVRVARRK